MPNWVQANVTFKGSNEELEKFYNDCGGNGNFSFNTFIPMPEELNIEASSYSNPAATLAWSQTGNVKDVELLEQTIWRNMSCSECLIKAKKYEESFHTEAEKEAFHQLGQNILNNLRKYGHTDWYSWRLNNWGTKWDIGGDVILSHPNNGEMTLDFQTAWAFPEPVFRTIAERYPSISFSGEYADEDTGYNCGEFSAEHGVFSLTEHEYDPKFACEVWGIDYEEYKREQEDDC